MASPPTASDSATRFGQLSLTHSQLKSKLQLHRESSTYGRRAVQEPRTEPDPPTEPWAVVPHQGYDVAFASLRMVVYQIDRTSAAHVAQEIRDKFSDAEVLELINGFTASHLMAVSKKPHQSRTKLFAFDEEQRPARLGALSKAIEEGRGRHAEWLRDRHMVDVDIMYKCAEYALVHNITLRSDKDKMAAEGGKPYHLYPFPHYHEHGQGMALSIVVPPEVLAKVYPPERCARLSIFIKTNTAPAEPLEAVAAEATASPKLPAPGTPVDGSDCQEEDEWSDLLGPPPSDGLLSATDPSREQGMWTASKAPFLRHPGVVEDEWLQRDLEKHKKNVEIWDRATWKLCEKTGVWRRHLTDKHPSVSVPGEDYPIKQGLCDTYTSDRNMSWHRENVENAASNEFEEHYKAYKALLVNAENFYRQLAQLYLQAKQFPHSEEHQLTLGHAMGSRAMLRHNLREARKGVVDSGVRCKRQLEAAHLQKPDELDSQWQRFVEYHTPAEEEVTQQQHSESAAIASTALGNTPRPQFLTCTPIKQVGPSARRPNLEQESARVALGTPRSSLTALLQHRARVVKKADSAVMHETVPFPKYQDPMIAPPVVANQQALKAPQPTQRSIAEVLIDTGIKRQATFQLPHHQTQRAPVLLGDPRSPITPDDWSETTETAEYKANEAVVSGALPNTDRKPTIAGDDSVPGSLMIQTTR